MKRNKREKRLAEVGGFDGQALANKFACVDEYKYASFRGFNLVGKPHDIWQIIVEAPIVDIYIYIDCLLKPRCFYSNHFLQ